MSEIRRANSDNGFSGNQLSNSLSGKNGEITDVEICDQREATALIDDYQFVGQKVIIGSFVFTEIHPFKDSGRQIPVDFMYREDSRLFIVRVSQGGISDEILREINSRLPPNVRIQGGIGGSREDIWNFVLSASRFGRIRIWHDEEVVDKNELDLTSEKLRNKLLWDAELYFEHPETGEEFLVIYNEESLSIDVDALNDMEHVLQCFENSLLAD